MLSWQEYDVKLLNLDETVLCDINIHAEELEKRRKELIDTDPFCIINTSGSTGTPKGVVLNYKSFFDFVTWADETFSFDGNEVIGALSPIVFDIYDFELCMMMFKGATIVLLDSSLGVFPARLLEELQKKQVNFIFWVPTIMVNIANMDLLAKLPLPDLKKPPGSEGHLRRHSGYRIQLPCHLPEWLPPLPQSGLSPDLSHEPQADIARK